MSSTETPPALKPIKQSNNSLLIWAVTATVAAVLFAFIALVLLVQIIIKPLPISVAFRPAFDSNNGLVAQLHNNSSESLKVLVTLSSPATGKTKEYEPLVPSGQIVEIGWVEGWAFVPGETMKIHNGKYRDLTFIVPTIPNPNR